MTRILLLIFSLSFFSCQQKHFTFTDVVELKDGDLTTNYIGNVGLNKLQFTWTKQKPMQSYKIYSTGDNPKYDPSQWILKGSEDGQNWTTIDSSKDQIYCARFQEIERTIKDPNNYEHYAFEISTAQNDTLKIAEIVLSEENLTAKWKHFKYPSIKFESLAPNTEGDIIYNQLVQNADEYIKYHCQKVAEILYFTDQDEITDVQEISYTLKDYDGVSAKGGNAPNINIVYSTQHIEKSSKESLFKLDFETRGVLYHELTHGYQFEPKGIGNYGNNKTFWSCIEGTADAVRAEAGLFDMSTRKPGGNWMDGYRTTGFFIQWLTTKDKDAIRKFHRTARDLDVWSWDGAIKSVFGPNTSIEQMWKEYQTFLESEL